MSNTQTVAELATYGYCFGAECKCGFKTIDLNALPEHVRAMTVPEAARKLICKVCGEHYRTNVHSVSGFGRHL